MLSKKNRIPREVVKEVISEGRKGYSELFLFKKKYNNLDFNRYTIIVSKRVSKTAVGRNLIKRKIKRAIKEISNYDYIKQIRDTKNEKKFLDIIIISLPTIKKADYKKIINEINNKKVLY